MKVTTSLKPLSDIGDVTLPKNNLPRQTKTRQKRRPRRSTEEIVDRIIEAAGEEFERNGYAGTTTAAVARKAGVVEALIFSNFGSKAKLFHDSIFKPLNKHFLGFCSTHLVDADDETGLQQETQQYILELQRFIERHSRMLMSLAVTQMYESDNLHGLNQVEGLNDYFARTAAMAHKRYTEKPRFDPKLVARTSFATILACVMFKDWLFPKGIASDDEIRAVISGYVMEGINVNADRKPDPKRAVRLRSTPRVSRAKKTK